MAKFDLRSMELFRYGGAKLIEIISNHEVIEFVALGPRGSPGPTGISSGWIPISSVILDNDSTTIDFSDISDEYQHLKLVCSLRADTIGSLENVFIACNGDILDVNYDKEHIQATGSVVTGVEAFASSSSRRIAVCTGSLAVDNTFSISEIIIPYYATNDRFKLIMTENIHWSGRTSGLFSVRKYGLGWANTNPIDHITLEPATPGSMFIVGSRIDLYGIKSGSPV